MDTERRRHPRRNTLMAIMVTPNGDRHAATVLDVSAGGARMRLPDEHWTPSEGSALRMFFEVDEEQTIAVRGRVVRVCIDHFGVQFGPKQERQIHDLLDSIN